MAAHTLALPTPASFRRASVPVHAAFSTSRDVLAVLWEFGHLELFDLRTRLGPGKAKVMDPLPLWSGPVGSRGVRQVVFDHVSAERCTTRLAVLGTDTATDSVDVVSVIQLYGDEKSAELVEVALPSRNGRFVSGPDPGIFWQAQDGHVYEGQLHISRVTYLYSLIG